MDVEGRSAWTLVPMVLIARRCVNTSSGDTSFPHTPMEAFCPHTPFHGRGNECFTTHPHTGASKALHKGHLTPDMIQGEYLVLSMGEGCGDARKARRACGPCPHPPL